MVSSPFPSFFLTIAYIFLVEYGIPKYMENRKPYELRKFMIIYNFSMVALSGYVFLEVCILSVLSLLRFYLYLFEFVAINSAGRSYRRLLYCILFLYCICIDCIVIILYFFTFVIHCIYIPI